MKKIAILGAGITGLSAAWFLKKRFGKALEIEIYEKNNQVGGWIRSKHEKGFIFEEGPRGFRPAGKGETTLELIKELKLEKELVAASKKARTRYLYLNQRLQPFSLPFLFKQGLLGAILRDALTPPSKEEDETIANFVCRRLSKNLAEKVIDPLAKGIFGGDCHTLSVRSCLPFLWRCDQQNRSIFLALLKQKKPPVSLYTLRNGMATLPKALAENLNLPIHFGAEVHSLHEIEADFILSALPPSALAPLIGIEDPFSYASLSVVSLGWSQKVLKRSGYGFLVPSQESHNLKNILGMTFDSEIFPEQNEGEQTRIAVMLSAVKEESEIYSLALAGVQKALGIDQPPACFSVRRLKCAIPQYTLMHHERVEHFRQKCPHNLYALGNGFEGVGINDCIASTKKWVESL